MRFGVQMVFLDHLSGGRVLFGIGRGLARREYAGFGISMDESRDRFDEAARMVLDALETGFIEGSDSRSCVPCICPCRLGAPPTT